MQGRCEKHPFEQAEDRCGRCGHEYCPECLVYPFGASKPPFCILCAVAAAGIRSNARGTLPRKELRRIDRERKAALKAARKAAKAPQPAMPEGAVAMAEQPAQEPAEALEPTFAPFVTG